MVVYSLNPRPGKVGVDLCEFQSRQRYQLKTKQKPKTRKNKTSEKRSCEQERLRHHALKSSKKSWALKCLLRVTAEQGAPTMWKETRTYTNCSGAFRKSLSTLWGKLRCSCDYKASQEEL